MSGDLLNILSNSNKDIDNQKLMDYLSGKLTGEEKHAVEQWMVDNNFENEAMEGLQNMPPQKNLQEYVDQLNKELHRYIQQKKQRRERKRWKDNPLVYIAIALILVLIVISYWVLRRMNH